MIRLHFSFDSVKKSMEKCIDGLYEYPWLLIERTVSFKLLASEVKNGKSKAIHRHGHPGRCVFDVTSERVGLCG